MDSTLGTALTGILGTILALAIVLGLAFLVLKGLRQWQDGGFGRRRDEAGPKLRFVRALPVGPRERLMLVEAEGELMLVGVAAGSVRLLRNWGQPETVAPDDASNDPEPRLP